MLIPLQVSGEVDGFGFRQLGTMVAEPPATMRAALLRFWIKSLIS